MSELEHYGMKERKTSTQKVEEAIVSQAAHPAEAAKAAKPAEPAEAVSSKSASSTEQRSPKITKVSLAEAFDEEPDISPGHDISDSSTPQKEDTKAEGIRDPFEPAPQTADSVVTNVLSPSTDTQKTNEGNSDFDPFAPQTTPQTVANANTQSSYATSSGYTPTREVTSAAYLEAAYNQSSGQSYNYNDYSGTPPRRNNKATGALVCGILAIVFSWTTIPGIILGIVAVVLAGSYTDLWGKSTKTTVAKITGVLGIVASTLILAFSLLSFALYSLADDLPYTINDDTATSSTTENPSFLDLLPLDELGNIVTGKDSPNAPLSGQERFAAEAAMEALKQIPKNTSMLTALGTNADEYFADLNGGIRLKDIGLSGADVVRWLVENMQCSVANDGVFITDTNKAMVFVDAQTPTMWTYTDAATESFEQKYGAAEMDTEKEYLDALGDAYKTASTTADIEERYLSLNLTNINGTWVVDSDSLLQQAEYLFDLWS